MSTLAGKTLFITGGSRGIGKAIALRAAEDGANIIIASKTAEPHPKLPGTIYTAADEIEKKGGKPLPLIMDIRDEKGVQQAMEKGADTFGGIDILINNDSAIYLAGTLDTPVQYFDLMHDISVRGTFIATQACLPYLKRAVNPHILIFAPPLKIDTRWFANFLAYTMSKYGMSMCVLGMAEEFKDYGIAVNGLWPRTTIATAAIKNLLGDEQTINCSRKPSIMADAAYFLLRRDSRKTTGNFFIDDEVLTFEGVIDLDQYAVAPGQDLVPDFFL